MATLPKYLTQDELKRFFDAIELLLRILSATNHFSF
jgi:hypothetical protein